MPWRANRGTRSPQSPISEPDNLPERLYERAGQVERRPGHARGTTLIQVEDLIGAALGPDGYMHPLSEDSEGNVYIIDGKQLMLELIRYQRLTVLLLAKLGNVDDPFEIDLDQDDREGE